MRSSHHLQREISLRQEVDRLQAALAHEATGWGLYAHRRNRDRLAAAQEEMSQISEDLEWVFAGEGIYSNGIALNRLIELSEPLGRALRWTSKDLLLLEGVPESSVSNGNLVEPVITSTFRGSFGLRLARPPVDEQLLFGSEETLFERSVSRLVAVFAAAHDSEDPRDAILESLRGFRQHTLNGIRDLSDRLAKGGRPSLIRWRRDEIVTVRSVDAREIEETIAGADPNEREITVRAALTGADLVSRSFHLVERRPGLRDRHYRGKTEPDAIAGLRIQLGTEVEAKILVLSIDSLLLAEPKESFLLRRITPVQELGPQF